MILEDVLSLIGGSELPDSDYMPIACLLKSGYGCVGYFNKSVNQKLTASIVLLNMRLVDLRTEDGHSRRGRVADFNDFLQDVVSQHVQAELSSDATEATHAEGTIPLEFEVFGKLLTSPDETENAEGTIPLTAIPVSDIAMLYPVAHIAKLLKTAKRVAQGDRSGAMAEVPTFLDFNNKSVVLKVLRAKIW